MTFKPTLRRNGEHMVTIRPRFDLERRDVVSRLACISYDDVTDFGTNPDAEISRAAAERAVVEHCQAYGTSWDEEDEDPSDEQMEWAERQVSRLWPEL